MNPLLTASSIRPNPIKDPSDPRIGHLIQTSITESTKYAIVGFPSDKGVSLNNGRMGASKGPDAIREQLYKFTAACSKNSIFACWKKVADIGNCIIKNDLSIDHPTLGTVVSSLFKKGITPIILGGGHETSYGHFLGYLNRNKQIRIINLDAHLDVRPYPNGSHSGSPFRQILEHSSAICNRYDVFGVQKQSSAKTHVDYVNQKGSCNYRDDIHNWPIEEILTASSEPIMLTIDLDLFDQSIMPGVSAPAVNGILLHEFKPVLERIIRSKRIFSVDIVELNPQYDRDHQSSRLATWVVWYIIGLLEETKSN